MACGVADGKENGFVLGLRAVESLIAPRIPVNRIVGVLQQVRAGFVRQAVGWMLGGQGGHTQGSGQGEGGGCEHTMKGNGAPEESRKARIVWGLVKP